VQGEKLIQNRKKLPIWMRVLEKTHPKLMKSSDLDESVRGELDFLPARKE